MALQLDTFPDHARIIQYDEGNLAQAQIPVEKLYHRWNISMQFVTRRDVLHLKGVNINVGMFLFISVRGLFIVQFIELSSINVLQL